MLSNPEKREMLYLQHVEVCREKLIRYCRRLAGDALAEDMAQETLIRAWERLEQLDDPHKAERWLLSIARNLHLSNSRRIPEPAEEGAALLHPSAEEEVLRQEHYAFLNRLLMELPHMQKQAVYYCCMLGHKPARLARFLRVSSHTVSARLFRGLTALRKTPRELD